jgi:hypothetical protein
VVWVNNPSRFIEIDPFMGMRRALSRLPQYLMNAIFGEAWAVDVVIKNAFPSIVYHREVFW